MLIPDHHPGFVTWERYERTQDRAPGQLAGAARPRWRRGPRRDRPAAGPGPLRTLRTDDAGRLLGHDRQHPALSLRPQQAALWRRAGMPEPRRAPAREPGPRRGLRHARAGQPGGDRQGARRGRRQPPPACRGLRAGRRTGPLRGRAGPPPVRRRRAREPPGGPDPRAVPGGRPWSAQRQAEANLAAQRLRQPTRLTDEETAWLERAGADVRAVFHAPTTTWRERKQLLRAVITEVVVTVRAAERRAEVNIVWEGGATTGFESISTRPASTSAPPTRTPSTWSAVWPSAMTTRRSPPILSKQGRRTGTGLAFTQDQSEDPPESHGASPPISRRAVTPTDDDVAVVSITARREDCSACRRVTLYRWLQRRVHRRRAAHARQAPGTSASPTISAAASSPTSPTAGSGSTRRPRRSAWPARRCCTRSNAASSRPSTSTRDEEKACVST